MGFGGFAPAQGGNGGGGGSPTGAAGGDLAGSYPNPTITSGYVDLYTHQTISGTKVFNRIQAAGNPIIGTDLTTKDYVDNATAAPSGPAGGDLSGTYPNPTLGNLVVSGNKIADGAILQSHVANGYVDLSSNQTVSGTKVFNRIQSAGNPIIGTDLTTKDYVDNLDDLLAALPSGEQYELSVLSLASEETQPAGDVNKSWKVASSDSDGSHLLAAVTSTGRLYTSSDYGATWTERQPGGDVNLNWYDAASDSDGSNLIACVYTGRLYTSDDYGVTWTERQPNGDSGFAWSSVASDSDGSNLIACVVNGRLYTSSNGGVGWTERQPAGAVNKAWVGVASDSDGSHLIACVTGGRVYISSNSGVDWSETQPAGDTNQDWAAVASDSDGSNLFAAAGSGRLYTSSDFGTTWTERQPAGDSSYLWDNIASDSDGSHLIAGISDGRLYTSNNYGVTWVERQPAGDANGYWKAIACTSNGNRLFVGNSLPGRLYILKLTNKYSKNSDFVDLTSNQTISGTKIFSRIQAAGNPIIGTDLTTKDYVDGISAPPSGVAGGDLTGTYPNPTLGTSVVSGNKIADGSILQSHVANGYVDLTSNQTISGNKTFFRPKAAGNPIAATDLATKAYVDASGAAYAIPHTWTIAGTVNVPVGNVDFINPFFVPVSTQETITLTKAFYKLRDGNQATVRLQKNDLSIPGYVGINVTRAKGTNTSGNTTFTDGDKLSLLVSAVSGTPTNMSFTAVLQHAKL